MATPLATWLLLWAAAQAGVAPGSGTGSAAGTGTGSAASDTAPEAPLDRPSQKTAQDDFTGPAGVPFVPSVGLAQDSTRGVLLDLALLSEFRAWTIVPTTGATTWASDVEITPGVAIEARTPRLRLSLGYAPRLTVPIDTGEIALAVLNRATARIEWSPSERWKLTALGLFVVGDYSQIVPASTPGGPGPVPPVQNPVRSFQTYPYVGIDTLLRVEGALSQRTRLQLSGGYFDVGGTGVVGEANQPRAWGPQGGASLAWSASRFATLTTALQGQGWIMQGDVFFSLVTLTEGWTQGWNPDLDTTFTLGVGLANQDVATSIAWQHLVPVAQANLAYRLVSRQRLTLLVDLSLAPYFDTWQRLPYQRFTSRIGLDWRPGDAWLLSASFFAALVPYTFVYVDWYGTAGLSASYSPTRILIFSLGGFSQVQFAGPTANGAGFLQWTTYLSITLRETLSL